MVLRASNDGSTDALAIGGPVRAGNVLDLRPGGVDLAGNAQDRTALPIDLGGATATGFALSSAELALIDTPTLVVGSNTHAADISVTGAFASDGALTLQNGGAATLASARRYRPLNWASKARATSRRPRRRRSRPVRCSRARPAAASTCAIR